MTLLPGRLVLIGHPVAHSMSPSFQNAALRAAGIPLVYEALDVEPADLDAVLRDFAAMNAAGNVTLPHKERFAVRCAQRTPVAERCGAVNVFWHDDGALHGDNTDVPAVEIVVRALLGEECASARVALIGAGGGAAAVLCAAERWGARSVRLYNRHMPRAQQLSARFPELATTVASIDEALRDATLVVNATPVGMRDDSFPVPIAMLPVGAAVFDLVYHAHESAWTRAARAAGHRAADGGEMLVEQGALAFERWFGRTPDRDVMWRAMS